MSCKSALYAANINTQTLTDGDVINFGSIVRRFGSNCILTGGNAVCMGSGYYDIEVHFSASSANTGNVIFGLYKDGTMIPGSLTTATIPSTNGFVSVTIPVLVRQLCCGDTTITARVIEGDVSIPDASIKVIKV